LIAERKPKFLLAENLNRLARYLRMLGYDAAVYKKISFSNRIRLVNKDKRVYLTRSKKEAKSNIKFARKQIISEIIWEQLQELQDYISYSEKHLFSRCLECNKKLYSIEKEKIKALVPDFIYAEHDNFYLCRKCGRIYWLGSHSQEMEKTLKKFTKKKL